MFRRGEINYFLVAISVIAMATILSTKAEEGPISNEWREVAVALCSGYLSGILIYFLTSVLPKRIEREERIRLFNRELYEFIKYSFKRLSIITEDTEINGPLVTKESIIKRCERITFGYTKSDRGHSLLKRLKKIRIDARDLEKQALLHSEYIIGSDSWRMAMRFINHSVIDEKNRAYLKKEESLMLQENVKIGSLIADFYSGLKECNQTIDKDRLS